MLESAFALSLILAAPAGRLDLEPEDLRTGLIAEYRSIAEPTANVIRVEAKPAFFLGDSSLHPRLPAGPFEATWTGVISIRDPGPITFSAFALGEVAVTVDGTDVLVGSSTKDATRTAGTKPLAREPGYYTLAIRFRSHKDMPARLQLWWEGPGFAAEPVPAWRFGYLAKDRTPALEASEKSAIGRVEVARHGCAQCHSSAFPAVNDHPPGPALGGLGRRVSKAWLLNWLENPASVKPGAHMPALFPKDRAGFVDRWILTDFLLNGEAKPSPREDAGDHRKGRLSFMSLGCAACHFVPDVQRAAQKDLNRVPLSGLGDRFSAEDLAAFLGNPHYRYMDGRMPQIGLTPVEARNIASFLLLWLKPSVDAPLPKAPGEEELKDAYRRRDADSSGEAAARILKDYNCASCHFGLREDRPIRDLTAGCMGEKGGPRFIFKPDTRSAIATYLATAALEKHPSPFATRQHRLDQAGCVRCHQRDSDRPSPLEEVSASFGGSALQTVPFLRTPRLTYPHQKFTRVHLASAVRKGVKGLRWDRFTFRMPSFSYETDVLVQALAEADGERPVAEDEPVAVAEDPTLGTVHGSRLAGFQGYACASCHVWNGKLLGSPDPGATGPDLTRTAGRIRRDWFDRYLENPLRFHPGSPMPAVFLHGKPAPITTVLDGDSSKQRDALWSYFAQGKTAPGPKPPPPVPVEAPKQAEPPIVAQIPIRFADGKVVESLSILTDVHQLLVYDLLEGTPHAFLNGGQILRSVQGRIRQYLAAGMPTKLSHSPSVRLFVGEKPQLPVERTLLGYDRLGDAGGAVLLRWRLRFEAGVLDVKETLIIAESEKKGGRRLLRLFEISAIPAKASVELQLKSPMELPMSFEARTDPKRSERVKDIQFIELVPDRDGKVEIGLGYQLPPAKQPPAWDEKPFPFAHLVEGSLERPGYRAIAYPRPKNIAGEDAIMPVALAVRPRDGQVFISSLNSGEILALRDPTGDGTKATFVNYTNGLYQDALSMLAEDDGLYVLHRRNLTKVTETKRDGFADRFDRIAHLTQAISDGYDMGYGLARDKAGRFVFTHAPHGDRTIPGAGAILRYRPGSKPVEVAHGLRNPLGFCAGPDGEVFVTDNQGEWVASNKLCHVEDGKFYGYPNKARPETAKLPMAKTTIWVPYAWARSINGVTYDNTGGKFGPFAGQVFMAELMFGGAVVRANLEKVNGVYQGACFPFWGKGLLGPMSVAFDLNGRLWVGSITEPGWMAMPDRGALYRIDFTGQVPFEMQSMHVLKRGFRVVFTKPVDRALAAKATSYRLESYRYEYTGSYGSPELDRGAVKIESVTIAEDGKSVEITTAPLVTDRVYMLSAEGVRSAAGEALVHPTGAYTLNEVPR